MPTHPLALIALSAVASLCLCHAGADGSEAMLTPDFWIARCADPDAVLLDRSAVAEANRRLLSREKTVVDMASLPPAIPRDDVVARITARSTLPKAPLFLADGSAAGAAEARRWQDAIALDAVPTTTAPRYGLVVRRAQLRRFPSRDRVHAAAGESDIDLFQESALFPGTPVAAIHTTTDGRWQFVITPTYAAWVETDAIAFGPRDVVLDYVGRATRTVTGGQEQTVFTPECPAVSRVVLDMGAALPEVRDWPLDEAVNGQSAVAGRVVEMPLRDPDGSLRIVPALLPRSADTHDGPLPATRGNVLRQAFKFLGERYGWGHDYGTRDCSGFVGEVYRSLGILLPRNTRDQAACEAFDRTPVAAEASRATRLAELAGLLPGDLVYVPGHVMMVVGHDRSGAWVIHDTHGSPAGGVPAANGVVVSPLVSLEGPGGGSLVDTVTVLVRILPRPDRKTR